MVDNFPSSPGVYIMMTAEGAVIYVGKARNLKKRVRSYVGDTRDSRIHIRFMVQQVASIEYIVTDTEKEALILENTLIKQHRPKYNINLRDDKTYFSLRMDMKEPFPRLSLVRKVPADGARYFGPYSSATSAKEVLKQLYKMFPLRHYPLATCMARKRPCLYHQIKQCSAPCCGLITAEAYAELAEGAALFLEGKNTEIARLYRTRMSQASQEMRYEDAARYRDLLRAIEVTVERQKMVAKGGDSDVFGVHREADRMQIAMLHIRGGTMTGGRGFLFDWEMEDEEGLASFLNEYYDLDTPIPQSILIPFQIAEPAALEELLTEKSGKKVTISAPQRGPKLEMVKLAQKNVGRPPGRARGEVAPAAPPEEDRVLRHLQHPGGDGGGKPCGLHRRQGRPVALPALPDQGGAAVRRLRHDAGGVVAPVQGGERRGEAGPDRGGRGPGPAERAERGTGGTFGDRGGGGGAGEEPGGARHGERGDLAERRAGVQARAQEPDFAQAELGAAAVTGPHQGRGAPLCRHLPQGRAEQVDDHVADRGCAGDRREAEEGAAGALRESEAGEGGDRGGACGDPWNDRERRKGALGAAEKAGVIRPITSPSSNQTRSASRQP